MNIMAYNGAEPQVDKESDLVNTYLQGDVNILDSFLYNADVRNDEHQGSIFIIKSDLAGVVHCTTGNNMYVIRDTRAENGSIIHGANLDHVVLNEFATIDQTDAANSELGKLSYVSSDQSYADQETGDGAIRIDRGKFHLRRDIPASFVDEAVAQRNTLRTQYITLENNNNKSSNGNFMHPYSVIINSKTSDRNFIAQRASVTGSELGTGTNIQEGCIVDCVDAGQYNIFAHNAIGINTTMGNNNFFMFNAMAKNAKLGNYTMLLPGTTVESNPKNPINLDNGIYFGRIQSQKDANRNKISFYDLTKTSSGKQFYESLMHRVEHILELNGGLEHINGHAQNHHGLKYKRM